VTRAVPFRMTFHAFLWPLWERNKLGYKIAACVLFGLTIAVYLPMSDVTRQFLSSVYSLICVFLTFTVVGFVPYGMGIQAAAQTSSTYAKVIFTLPVSNEDFVFIPILIAIGGFTFLWLLFVAASIVPLHFYFPVELPIIQAAAMVGLTQCCWLLSVWKRSLVALSMLSVTVVGFLQFEVMFGLLFEGTAPVARYGTAIPGGLFFRSDEELVLGVVAILSILMAMAVAPYARHQASLSRWKLPQRRRILATSNPAPVVLKPKLGSALSAQTWFEGSRRFILLVPSATVGTAFAFLGLASLLESREASMASLHYMGPSYLLSPWMPLPLLLLAGLYFAVLFGPTSPTAASMKGRNHFKEPGINAFVAIRPISSAQLVTARLFMAAKSSVIAGVALAVFFALWPIGAVGTGGNNATVLSHLVSLPTIQNLLLAAVILISLPLLLWCFQVGNVFMDLFGVKGWLIGIGCAGPPLIYLVLQFMDGTLYKLDFLRKGASVNTGLLEHPDVLAKLIGELTIAGVVLIGIKAVLLVISVIRIRRRKLVEDRNLIAYGGIWIATATALVGGFYALLPPGMLSAPYLALIVALVLPLNRILMQIVTVDSNRHR